MTYAVDMSRDLTLDVFLDVAADGDADDLGDRQIRGGSFGGDRLSKYAGRVIPAPGR